MSDRGTPRLDQGYPPLMRRDRLERIANAERDRRAGRVDVAIATIGEPVEWPARAVLALARLGRSEEASRRILEEGLDLWAREVGVGELDFARVEDDDAEEMRTQLAYFAADAASMSTSLDAPIELSELDRAFDEAEADVEAMHHVNDVAERVLMDEPTHFAELEDDDLAPSDVDENTPPFDPVSGVLGLDAACVEPIPIAPSMPDAALDTNLAEAPANDLDARQRVMLATLETWLQNLEHRRAGRNG